MVSNCVYIAFNLKFMILNFIFEEEKYNIAYKFENLLQNRPLNPLFRLSCLKIELCYIEEKIE